MNRVFCLVWSACRQQYVVAHERARSGGRGRSGVAGGTAGVLLVSLLGTALAAPVLPGGGQVSAGSASISTQGANLTVRQSTSRAAINWTSFSIGSGASVDFVQPDASAITLNRVVGSEQSVIDGALRANGQVFLLNANGLLFGKGAQVNVGGLVASTLALSDADFLAGRYQFDGAGAAAGVRNQGTLQAAEGGYIALLGSQVRNEGSISARLGSAVLAAGGRLRLNFDGNALLGVTLTEGTLDSLVENRQAIVADGGQVILTAKGVDQLLSGVVNNSGEVRAQAVASRDGRILLLGDMEHGAVRVDGSLDASGGQGGFIETSAARVQVADQARIASVGAQGKGGQWLIDPADFTIAASGGDISGSALGQLLRDNNVTIESAQGAHGQHGDILVRDPVRWEANQLTLSAQRNIDIAADLGGSGSASLALEYGLASPAAGNGADYLLREGARISLPSGPRFSTRQGSDGVATVYTVLSGLGEEGSASGTDLQGIQAALDGNFALGADLNASATAAWDGGFMPIGALPQAFSGRFAGLGHTVTGLSIARPGMSLVGLFGQLGTQAEVRDLTLDAVHIGGYFSVGALAGWNQGSVRGSSASGTVSGSFQVGGLVGENHGSISASRAAVSVSGDAGYVGGLAGSNGGLIADSSASGSVDGSSYGGGLVGGNGGAIQNSHASGAVSGPANLGGLVGMTEIGSTIVGSSASGQVSSDGGNSIGGLVGIHQGSITDSQASGDVSSGGYYVGGLIGSIMSAAVSGSSATGRVTGLSVVGGLVGANFGGTIATSRASGTVSASGEVAGGLVGQNLGGVETSHARGAVSAFRSAGGLVGLNDTGGSIVASAASGAVSGYQSIGGLAGSNSDTISNSYASGTASGQYSIGGLVGENTGTVGNSYALGNPSGEGFIGGVVGYLSAGSVSNVYAANTPSSPGNTAVGGVVGLRGAGLLTDSYWDVTLSGTTVGVGGGTNSGATGLSPAQMRSASSFDSFSFSSSPGARGNAWVIVNADGGLNNAGGASGATRPMLASEYATTIDNAHALQLMAMDRAASYTLKGNIDVAVTQAGSQDVWSGSGFVPVGSLKQPFSGSFDGQGHTIAGLFIDPDYQDGVGLFGATAAGASVRRVGLLDAQVAGNLQVGTLVGRNAGTVSGSYATGLASATHTAGGLVGENVGTVRDSYAAVTVLGADVLGGLAGTNSGTVATSYATGAVQAMAPAVGGLVGRNDGTLTGNVWATGGTLQGRAVGAGAAGDSNGLDARQLHSGASYGASWDFSDTWVQYEGYTAPLLRAFLTPLRVSANSASKTYDGQAFSGASVRYSVDEAKVLGTLRLTGTADGAVDAGTYTIVPTGLYSDQQGYAIDFAPGTLRIDQATLLLTPDNQRRTYGQANPAFTQRLSGFVPGEDASVLTGAVGDAGSVATTASNAGSYAILGNAGTLASNNYRIEVGSGTLTVDKAHLTVTPQHQSRTYGQANPAFPQQVTGFVNGDTASVIKGTLSAGSSSATATSPVGTYVIHGDTHGVAADNYDFTAADGVLTVGKAVLTVTPANQTRLYGQANPVFTQDVTGFVNGDGVAVLSGAVGAGSSSATAASGVGQYMITGNAAGLSAANYEVVVGNGTLSVDKAPLTVTPYDQQRLYGQANPFFSQHISGFVNGEDASVLSGSAGQGRSSATAASGVGQYAINGNADGLAAANYTFRTGAATLTVDRALLTVTPLDQQRLYGQANPVFEQRITGFVNGEDARVLDGTLRAGNSVASERSGVGQYAILGNASGLSAANYAFATGSGTLTIDKAVLTVTARDQTRLYGQPNPVFSQVLSGFVNGDDAGVLDGTLGAGSSSAGTASAAGRYTITANADGLAAANYRFQTAAGTLTVDKAHLTVTPLDQQRLYGLPNPVFTQVLSGFVNGENASVVSGTVGAGSSTASAISLPGQYRIAGNASGLSAANYDIQAADGSLRVAENPYLPRIIAAAGAPAGLAPAAPATEALAGTPGPLPPLRIADGGLRLPDELARQGQGGGQEP